MPLLLPSSTGPLGGMDRVPLQKFGIDSLRVFTGRNRAGHEVPVPVCDVLDDLLNKALNGGCLDGILPHVPCYGEGVGTCFLE